jgi:hypothetical protein
MALKIEKSCGKMGLSSKKEYNFIIFMPIVPR